ncbi:MAG: BatD family protein [Thermoanaerobaculales bacterium]|jgi:hypothetical protein|nr:BatD family protein [Thermoanaerobaculales bacterium]
MLGLGAGAGRRPRRAGAAALLLVGLAGLAGAAGPSLEVHLQPRRFGVDDIAQLTIRVNEPPADLAAPQLGSLDNLEVVGGPSTGSEFSFVNGVASRSQTFTYALRASRPGSATVGPVTVRAGGVELRAGAVTAEVVEGSVAPPRGRRSPFFTDPFADLAPRRTAPEVEVELRHVLSASRAAVGQPLVATVYLDSTSSALYDFNLRTPPSYPGFWAQRLDNPEQIAPEVVEVDGTGFYRYRVLRSVLVPLKPGSLEIPAVEASIGVRSRSVFDPGRLVERSAPALQVEVSARPAPPAGFAGAVGDLRYSASLEPPVIDFGSSAVLTVTLEGRGNLPLVEAPPVFPSSAACDSYPPEESSRVVVDDGGIHGSRSWQVTVVPREAGRIELAGVVLAVYDPEAGRYVSQPIGPLDLEVTPPPPTPTPVVTPAPPAAGADRRDQTPTSIGESGTPIWGLVVGALVAGLGLGAAVAWWVARRSGRVAVPPRQPDQSPADRARVLQLSLERWWLDARSGPRGAALEEEMQALRRDLEAVRFAPGRADHSDTVVDLESRLKRLLRSA